MKGLLLAVFGIKGTSGRGNKIGDDDDRRYLQLADMMSFENPDFDERKYWTYGCNCLMLGDRPMSDPGHGPPVDALDKVCKAYKDCLKCARQNHDETCLNEMVRYRFGKNKRREVRDKRDYLTFRVVDQNW